MLRIHSSVASRAKAGERVCGDGVEIAHGERHYMVAVADGLGHGSHAAAAARCAVEYVAAHPDDNVEDLLRRTDRVLVGSRGAVLTVMQFDTLAHTVVHAGVGNVTVVASTAEAIHPINAPGYFGGRVRRLLVTKHSVSEGDFFVLYTDGISSRFCLSVYKAHADVNVASAILANHAKEHDDATCVVLRILSS